MMVIKDLIPKVFTKKSVPVKREDFLNPFQNLHDNMNHMFNEFFRDFGMTHFSDSLSFSPQVDVEETDKEIKIQAELPGMDEKDIELSLTENMISIIGEKKMEREEKKGNYHSLERSYGSFHRNIPLPCEIEKDKVEAVYKNGVLKITLPKTEAAQKKIHQIKIKAE